MESKPPVRALPLSLAAALIVTLLAAAALRLWHLHLLPPGLYFDEAFNGMDEGNQFFAAAQADPGIIESVFQSHCHLRWRSHENSTLRGCP